MASNDIARADHASEQRIPRRRTRKQARDRGTLAVVSADRAAQRIEQAVARRADDRSGQITIRQCAGELGKAR
ncbi:MAG: hypothetical protein ACXWCY_11480 [Burkholderiales bacterium]